MANNDEADSDFLTKAPMLADIWRQPRVLIDVTERIDEIKYFFNSSWDKKKKASTSSKFGFRTSSFPHILICDRDFTF